MDKVQLIKNKNGDILALIARKIPFKEPLEFVTPSEFPLQTGFHNREAGVVIKPHKHPLYRDIAELKCQELFYILEGKIKVDIFDYSDSFVSSVVLQDGDLIVISSGHGVEFIEKTKMIEVRQGPYRKNDKEFI